MTSYDGRTIAYDEISNPTSDGIWNYTWEHGRQLVAMTGTDVGGGDNEISITYTYDADGMRIGKTVSSTVWEEVIVHTHEYTQEWVVATCTEPGYLIFSCDCGYSETVLRNAPLGHTYLGTNSSCIRCGYKPPDVSLPPVTPPIIRPPIDTASVEDNDWTEIQPSELYVTELRETITVTEHTYVYSGGLLMQEVIKTTTGTGENATVTTDTLNYSYDASGLPLTVTYNGTLYYYVTNLQGDVVALVNTSGTAVVNYTYDAWGNILSTTGTLANTLGRANALRYRSYVYDTETEFYYLQSRYYNPEIGRFLNADAFAATGQGTIGNNMFVYCLNNPLMFADSSGARAEFLYHCVRDGGGATPTPPPAPTPNYIYGQEVDPRGSMRFGLSTIAFSGCGPSSVYNASLLLGETDVNLQDIIRSFIASNSLIAQGVLGSLPHGAEVYLTAAGYTIQWIPATSTDNALIQSADACIMWYVRAYPDTTAHFVAFQQVGNTGYYYNAFSKGTTVYPFPGYPSDYFRDRNADFGYIILIFKDRGKQ